MQKHVFEFLGRRLTSTSPVPTETCSVPGLFAMPRRTGLRVLGRVGIPKVDVDGAELAVLRGTADLIRQWLPDIFVETKHGREFGADADLLLGFGMSRTAVMLGPRHICSLRSIGQGESERFVAANNGAKCADP
jgi:Methyltransferase FkbM domain